MSRTPAVLFVLSLAAAGSAVRLPVTSQLPKAAWNDNLESAGALRDGVLELNLEVTEANWHILGDERPGRPVLALAELGEQPSIPGPMIRVPIDTEVQVTLANRLDSAIVIHGLAARKTGPQQPLRIPPGQAREVRFRADVEGTFFYWGQTTGGSLEDRLFEDSQLQGALIIDPPGTTPEDRVMVLSSWFQERLADGSPNWATEYFAINGRSWPYTERLTYAMGDSVRWRLVNASPWVHPMHLHGFYFRVDSRGDIARDTIYWQHERRMAVTERLEPGTTMRMAWSPDRPGGWIFHCHNSWHVTLNPPITNDRPSEDEWFGSMFTEGHIEHDPDQHVLFGMGGLMMGLYVEPPDGWVPDEPKRRQLRLFIQNGSAPGLTGSWFSYVLQEGPRAPARDSTQVPGSMIVLERGEPTSIWVINRSDEPSQVHWHGLEIESYFDGVAGVGGYPERITPAIAPGDSFEIRITPPRSGSFMYHTHVNDLRQQSSGLYGAFLVVDDRRVWDAETDRVFLLAHSPGEEDVEEVLNGEREPAPLSFQRGVEYRFRLMNITLGQGSARFRLLLDDFPVKWRPLAKDGWDVPAHQSDPQPADLPVGVGETYDFAYTPSKPGELHLEVRQPDGRLLVNQPIVVFE